MDVSAGNSVQSLHGSVIRTEPLSELTGDSELFIVPATAVPDADALIAEQDRQHQFWQIAFDRTGRAQTDHPGSPAPLEERRECADAAAAASRFSTAVIAGMSSLRKASINNRKLNLTIVRRPVHRRTLSRTPCHRTGGRGRLSPWFVRCRAPSWRLALRQALCLNGMSGPLLRAPARWSGIGQSRQSSTRSNHPGRLAAPVAGPASARQVSSEALR